MARKNFENLIKSPEDLTDLIEQYVHNKEEMDHFKELCDETNGTIKTLMMSDNSLLEDDGKYVKLTDSYKAVITIKERRSMDEVKLLEVIRESGIEGIIKTREYVDLEALEAAIYSGDISKDMLLRIDTCKDVKKIPELRITSLKK